MAARLQSALLLDSDVHWQVVEMPAASGPLELEYDAAWLAILRETHDLLNVGSFTRLPASWQGMYIDKTS